MSHVKGDVSALVKPDTMNTRTATGNHWSAALALAGLLKLMPNPSTLLKKIGKDITVYDELLLDGKVSAAVQAFNAGVTSREFTVVPGDCPVDVFTEIQSVIESLPVTQLIEEILTAKQYGYAVHELEWSMGPAGRIDPTGATLKPAKWFGFDDKGTLLFRSAEHPEGETIPNRMKVIVSRNQPTATNPYGRSNLELCYWPVQIKKTNLEFWLIFAERYGMPWPTVTYDPIFFEDRDKVDELAATVAEMYQDGILVIPASVSADVKTTGSSSNSAIYREAIEYVDSIITQVWLGHSGAMEGTPGALGDQETAVQVREDIVVSGARLVEAFFAQLIEYMNIMNYNLPKDKLPWIELRKPERVDVDKLLARATILYQTHGITFSKEFYSRMLGIDPDTFRLPAASSNDVGKTVGGVNLIYQYHIAYVEGKIPRDVCVNMAMTSLAYDYQDALSLFPANAFGVSKPEPAPGLPFAGEQTNDDTPKTFSVELGEDLTDTQATLETLLGSALDEQEAAKSVGPIIELLEKKLSGMSKDEALEFLNSPEAFDMLPTGTVEENQIRMQFLSLLIGTLAETP